MAAVQKGLKIWEVQVLNILGNFLRLALAER